MPQGYAEISKDWKEDILVFDKHTGDVLNMKIIKKNGRRRLRSNCRRTRRDWDSGMSRT